MSDSPKLKKTRSEKRIEANERRQKRRAQKIASRKKMNQSDRKKDAKSWLRGHLKRTGLPKKLVKRYQERYRVDKNTAFCELAEIGYYHEVQIEEYEQDGVEWKFEVDGYDGELKVVPKDTQNSEFVEF